MEMRLFEGVFQHCVALPTTKVLVLLSTASLYDILSKAVRQNRKERYSSKMASGRNGPLAGWM